MFEWGGGSIWCDDPSAFVHFGAGPVEDRLPLSDALRQKLKAMNEWHDQALDWSNPAGPSPWTRVEFEKFEIAAQELLREIQATLGPRFNVRYDPIRER